MKKVFFGIDKICFEYGTSEQLREECEKYSFFFTGIFAIYLSGLQYVREMINVRK